MTHVSTKEPRILRFSDRITTKNHVLSHLTNTLWPEGVSVRYCRDNEVHRISDKVLVNA